MKFLKRPHIYKLSQLFSFQLWPVSPQIFYYSLCLVRNHMLLVFLDLETLYLCWIFLSEFENILALYHKCNHSQNNILAWLFIINATIARITIRITVKTTLQNCFLFIHFSNYSFCTLSNFSEQFSMLTLSSSRFSSAPHLTLPLELPWSSTYKGPSCHQTAVKNKTCDRQQNLFSSHLIWLLKSLRHSLLVFYPLPLGKGKKQVSAFLNQNTKEPNSTWPHQKYQREKQTFHSYFYT